MPDFPTLLHALAQAIQHLSSLGASVSASIVLDKPHPPYCMLNGTTPAGTGHLRLQAEHAKKQAESCLQDLTTYVLHTPSALFHRHFALHIGTNPKNDGLSLALCGTAISDKATPADVHKKAAKIWKTVAQLPVSHARSFLVEGMAIEAPSPEAAFALCFTIKTNAKGRHKPHSIVHEIHQGHAHDQACATLLKSLA